MKLVCCLLLALAFQGATAAQLRDDRAVTRVVKMLQDMMTKSKEDGDRDREVYVKFKCFCDTELAKKTREVERLTYEIQSSESDIEGYKGEEGALAAKRSEVTWDIAQNEQARATAQSLREQEHENFIAEEEDLVAAIGQMKLAIETLAEVGADQTLEAAAAADHKMFMGGHQASLLKMHARVKESLTAVSALMDPKHKKSVTFLIQAPFTGTYSAVSGEVVGILKTMRDTFVDNLSSAKTTEEKQSAAYDRFMSIKEDAFAQMTEMNDMYLDSIGESEKERSFIEDQLPDRIDQKDIKQNFLSELAPLCTERKKEFEQRRMLRSSEEAAVAEAISILNSDQAFGTFGKVDATTTGGTSFLQRASVVHRHGPTRSSSNRRQQAFQLLRKAASTQGSLRLAQVAGSLEAENPFEVVLKEIDNMINITAKEGKVDKEKLDFCRDERDKNNAELKEKEAEILELETSIDGLQNLIATPETGLKDSIASDEASLADNGESQKSATELRQEENAAYQEDIGHLTVAEDLLQRAVFLLKEYYAKVDDYAEVKKSGPVQLNGGKTFDADGVKTSFDGPTKHWSEDEEASVDIEGDKGYEGQSGKGNKAIEMIEFILEETKKEESKAHSDENAAQSDYEEFLTGLKEQEVKLRRDIAKLQGDLAEAAKELLDAKNLLKKTEAEKASILAYLESIKAGCDFMEDNFDLRETGRASETEALEQAAELLKGTPAFKAWEAADHNETLGACWDKCAKSEEHVLCKACLADTEIPGYCAGHPDTEGC